jgi:hypothetical protein
MKKSVLFLMITSCLSFGGLRDALSVAVEPGQGIVFEQVDFLFPAIQQADSSWGRLTAYPDRLSAFTRISRGYLNVYTASGWVIDNLLVDLNGPNPISVYFTLGPATPADVAALSAYVDLSRTPVTTFSDGSRNTFPVGTFQWDAQGAGDENVQAIDTPPPPRALPPVIISSLLAEDMECLQSDVENVETAVNQCVPMSVANSLQFLENSIGITVPDQHRIGLRGDDSLVGQLDQAMNRTVTDRASGHGVWFTPMMEGKFQYLADSNLSDDLEHKHQGRGYGQVLNDGDFEHAGITSTDQGDTVTWDFVCQEVCRGEDVELIYQHNSGGHAVRVVGCGNTGGKEWIMYAHDALQSNDTAGLETVKVNVEDLDSDTTLNLGSAGREVVFVLSESSANMPPDCSQAFADPEELWPPNHRFAPVEIMGVIDPEGEAVTIAIDAITQDEEVNGKGDGNTSPDGAGVGTDTAMVRAERQGSGSGRVYEISFTATDPAGAHCSGTVQVCVPHDRGRGSVCIDDGQLYDSTQVQSKKNKKNNNTQ